jgi:hypothetical protein
VQLGLSTTAARRDGSALWWHSAEFCRIHGSWQHERAPHVHRAVLRTMGHTGVEVDHTVGCVPSHQSTPQERVPAEHTQTQGYPNAVSSRRPQKR